MSYKIPLPSKFAKILVIDDEPDITNLVCKTLEAQGYTLTAENSGEQGIQRAISLHPDLILLDINMPDKDGYEVCKALRKEPSTKDIPIIFLTGKDILEDRYKSYQVGGDLFIKKPISPEILANIIKIVLSSIYKL
ncbi:MAG: response regulator receiver protein [candidate division Zixibacteria bacterium RBG-1]|nr:MAG: response regulator receiver protein [candidate division Zixibacteria bacterium RBG-1]OGC83662.1 MAG: hypothetical protein A2V73_03505 [candidate division Zixibacteria bacterium RBG_19FT_COMBO_42_43]